MSFLTNVGRCTLLAMIGIAIGLLWLYCSALLAHDLAQGGASLVLAERCAGVLTVLVMMVAPAIPIQSLFPRRPIAAAVAIGWTPLALGLLSAYPIIEGVPSAHRVGFAMTEGCVEWLAIVLGAWTISRLRHTAISSRENS